MPILRLVAEGVGPFEHIDVDFSDGNGNPHLGPHIIVGTNGTGKSTLLRTIAWGFAEDPTFGFDFGSWAQTMKGHTKSRSAMIMQPTDGVTAAYACGVLGQPGAQKWAQAVLGRNLGYKQDLGERLSNCCWLSDTGYHAGHWLLCVAYRPVPNLSLLKEPDLASRPGSGMEGALAFHSTVDNAKLQAWLMRLYSERAIATTESLSPERAQAVLWQIEQALQLMFGSEFRIKVHVPGFELQLETPMGTSNFSQLPDGLRSTLGWCGDFLMRRDRMMEEDRLVRRRGVLLIDEIESHLHPQWQRRILPGLRKALPDVQIIVTTHSPFVASSCPGAKLHICEREENKAATIRTETSPFGQKLLTTISGVFGIDSRFDVVTERDLNTWYALKKRQPTLNSKEQAKLTQLTAELSQRSEELKAIVAGPEQIPPQSVAALLASTSGKRRKVVK